MHESSTARALLRAAEAAVAADRADGGTGLPVRMTVRLGALSHLSADHVRGHLRRVSAGGPFEGVEVVVLDGDSGSPDAMDAVLESVDVAVTAGSGGEGEDPPCA